MAEKKTAHLTAWVEAPVLDVSSLSASMPGELRPMFGSLVSE